MSQAPTRILLVEDNAGDRSLIQAILDNAPSFPTELISVDRLGGGLAALREGAYDLVLLDMSLPDADEFEGFEALNSSHPEVPVVVLTGLDDDAAALEAVNRGAQDYLVKGCVDAEALTRAMRYAIERHRVVERLRQSLRRECEIADRLRESERQFRSLVTNIPGAVYRCGVSRPWWSQYVSESVRQIAGYPAQEFVERRRNWSSLVHPQDIDLLASAISDALRRRQPYRLEYRVLHPERGVLWVLDQGSAVFGEDGTPGFLEGVVCDITKRKAADEAFERLHRLEDRERIAMELHDGSIQSLFALGQSLQAKLGVNDPEVVQPLLADAIDEVDRIMRNLRNYIYGLRPDLLAGLGLERELRTLAKTFEMKGVHVAVQVDPVVASSLEALGTLRQHLIQTAREALSNAVRHSGAREVDLVLAHEGPSIVLQVRDQGRGFDPSRKRKGQGLENLRIRAAALGGELRVESAPGRGTTTSLRIPLTGEGTASAQT